MKTYVVYKHTNLKNGKAYVGWTSSTVQDRWKEHCYAAFYRSTYAFHRAIRKYGTVAWAHDVLEVHNSVIAARAAEVRLIAEHKTYVRDHPTRGYNMTLGGEGVTGLKWSPEKRARHSGTNSKLAKLSVDDVIALKRAFIAGMSQSQLAIAFNVSQPLISVILRLKRYPEVRLSEHEEAMVKLKLFNNDRKRRGAASPFWGMKRSSATRQLQREKALAREARKREARQSGQA